MRKAFDAIKSLYSSIWLFPVILLIVLLAGTALKIHGSSIGAYYPYFYGTTAEDPDLLFGKPRPIRSDEWLVATQKTIIQAENNFPRVNENIANGEDVSLQDQPYKEWSAILRPHNLIFFILPLEYAFSFKWLLLGILLLLSCYFFVLAILPRKRLIAALLSVSLLFSPFVQWWYTYGTLASLYYALFISTVVIYMLRSNNFKQKMLFSATIGYLLSCFAVVLYPPFQIATGLVMSAVILGLLIENYDKKKKKKFKRDIILLFSSIIIGVSIVAVFVFTRIDVIKTISETDYPGNRSLSSGGVPAQHFLSSHLNFQLQSRTATEKYLIDGTRATNQSEASGFILFSPLVLPLILINVFIAKKRKLKDNATILVLSGLLTVFILELFVTSFTPISKLFMLHQVGGWRALIGIGLLNAVLLVFIIRCLQSNNKTKIKNELTKLALYCGLIGFASLYVSYLVYKYNPGFISLRMAIIASLIVPVATFLLIRKRIVLSLGIYTAFCIMSSFIVNPVYRGLSIVTDNPLSNAIEEVGANNNDSWMSDGLFLQQIASINGERSITGVHFYPQLDLWGQEPSLDKKTYNRYSHIGAVLEENGSDPVDIVPVTPDSFYVRLDDCSDFLNDNGVRYIASTIVITNQSCLIKIQTISTPGQTFYIYENKRLKPSN